MINPCLGNLKWVKCTVPVYDSELRVEIHQSENSWKLSVENLTGKECIVAIHKNRLKSSINVDGKSIYYVEGKIEENDIIDLYLPENTDIVPQNCVLVKLKKSKVLISI